MTSELADVFPDPVHGSHDPPEEATGEEVPAGLLNILHQNEAFLVLNKPAGLVCHPTKRGETSSLAGRLRLVFGADTRVHMINRLDRETSGVVIVGFTTESARQLRRIWERREVNKEYLAIVHGRVTPDRGLIEAPLGRDDRSEITVKDRVREDGAEAQTEFEVVRRFERAEGEFSLLRVWPRTGRKHQIRIHLAHLGHCLVGDKLYGMDERYYLVFARGHLSEADWRRLVLPWQALHAREISFPWQGHPVRFETPAEPWFQRFCEIESGPVDLGSGMFGPEFPLNLS